MHTQTIYTDSHTNKKKSAALVSESTADMNKYDKLKFCVCVCVCTYLLLL